VIEPVKGMKPQRARCVTADNPGPLTLNGTNTWVLAEPGASRCVLVDPGPPDANHVQAVLGLLDAHKLTVALTIVTHGHEDHVGAVDDVYAATGAPVRGMDPRNCRGAVAFESADEVVIDDLLLRILATPGHTADSLSVLIPADAALLTGDTVLGEGSSLIAWPDGQLGPYLESLRTLRGIAAAGHAITLLPGHGPQVPNALPALDQLLMHREQRLEQVRMVLGDGAATVTEVARRVYGDLGPQLYDVVLNQVRAQLELLAARGEPRAGDALSSVG
jgi:glyoxylase-like metal-dependent hydrolase (beta-lactamase superfamily II)